MRFERGVITVLKLSARIVTWSDYAESYCIAARNPDVVMAADGHAYADGADHTHAWVDHHDALHCLVLRG